MPTRFSDTFKNPYMFFALLGCLAGILLRFFHITNSDFIFYDEGLYLNLHRKYLELVTLHPAANFQEFLEQLYGCFRLALGEGKALYIFASNVRVFWGGLEDWFVPRLISAVSGLLTIGVVFYFAKKYFQSFRAGILSAALLAVLPSHVFYSRLGLQETFCTLFFLLGFLFYLFPAKFGWRTFVSATFLVLAQFSNYRLIILPVLVLACEIVTSIALEKKFDFRKYLWHTLIFFFLVFAIGNIDHAQNTIVTFAWMFYQAQMAKDAFDPFNFLSYPYYIFRLEGVLFGLLFLVNIYYFYKKEYRKILPFALVLLHMCIFSLTAEKAMRYLAVVLPFMAMAVGGLIDYLLEEVKSKQARTALVAAVVAMSLMLFINSSRVAGFNTDYQTSVEYLKRITKHPKIVSTQHLIQSLYTNQKEDVVQCPKDFEKLVTLHAQGYGYLVVCPQSYISWTDSQKRFDPPLAGHLQFIKTQIRPIKTFAHFNQKMLERFVFEHNENFRQSLLFLKSDKGDFGKLQVYDLGECINTINHRLSVLGKRAAK